MKSSSLPGAARSGSDWCVLLMFCLLLLQTFLQLRAALAWGHDSWQLTEWLINYAGGFVRRGLPGSLAGWIAGSTGLPANLVVILLAGFCFAALACWFLRRATAFFHPALIVSCVVMGFPAYQDSIIRKDCLGLLLFIACIRAGSSSLPRITRVALVNLLACTAILSHEAFAMYALPALWFHPLCRKPWQGIRDVVIRTAEFLPSAVCFLLTVRYHGTAETALAINQSWLPLWRITDPGNVGVSAPAAAIEALGWSSEKGMSLGLTLLTSGFYQPLAWLAVYTVSFLLIVRFTRADALPTAKTRIASILLLQLPCISPLFILGYDYGRWLFLWAASSMILHATGFKAPAGFGNALAARPLRTGMDRMFSFWPTGSWPLLCFGVPVCWNLHAFLHAIPVIRHLKMLWQAF